VQVLQGKNFKNITKTFADILTEPCASLRDHVLMPVLWKRHFFLLWYCKKNNEVILYDSTSPVDTYLVSSIKKFLLSLLSNFFSSPPALKVDHMVDQKVHPVVVFVSATLLMLLPQTFWRCIIVIFMQTIIGCEYFLHLYFISLAVVNP